VGWGSPPPSLGFVSFTNERLRGREMTADLWVAMRARMFIVFVTKKGKTSYLIIARPVFGASFVLLRVNNGGGDLIKQITDGEKRRMGR